MRSDRLLRRCWLALGLLLLSCAGPRVGGHGAAPELRSLTILATGDTWGELEPCG